MSVLELYIPKREDLWFRRELLDDPGTMGYNKGYDLGIPEYHKDTGCIDFPEEKWDGWYARWVNAEPERFYAYMRRREDGAFLGEVNLYRKGPEGWYEMGIVLNAKYRGQGYSKEGMDLLLRHAFETMGAAAVENRFETTREAAWKLHRAAGFKPVGEENGVVTLVLTEERYRKLREGENRGTGRYYEAYDNRYKQIHERELSWASENPSPIVEEMLQKYGIARTDRILELGCGEGRDARYLLKQGYALTATDISPEAVRYCRERDPSHGSAYQILDAVDGECPVKFDFIYAVAVLHMLVLDEDRDRFYGFIRDHLTEKGTSLLLSMGDGEDEMQSDITRAFQNAKRVHEGTGQEVEVASTSCRMVTFAHFREEITRNGLTPLEMGITCIEPDFPTITYAVVKAVRQ